MYYLNKFDFIQDKTLRGILKSDYKEVLICVNRQAYKAAVVLSGGVVEAILMDLAFQNRALVEECWLKMFGGTKIRKVEKMKLNELIIILEELKLIPGVEASAADVLRDYRNMIHPVHYPKRPNKKDAKLVKQLLDNLILKFQGAQTLSISHNLEKAKLFFTHESYKKRRELPEYKEIISLFSKKNVVKFQEIKDLDSIKKKNNSGKYAASRLSYLKSLGLCDYDKNSWIGAPVKRHEEWIFNKQYSSIVEKYLRNTLPN